MAVFLEFGREVESVAGDVLEDVEAAAEQDLPAGVGDYRAVVDRVVERDVEVDAADCCALLDLHEELKLLAELLPPFVSFGGDELDVDFVSGVLDSGDPLDEFHEV